VEKNVRKLEAMNSGGWQKAERRETRRHERRRSTRLRTQITSQVTELYRFFNKSTAATDLSSFI
jgi:hypothetical protein